MNFLIYKMKMFYKICKEIIIECNIKSKKDNIDKTIRQVKKR